MIIVELKGGLGNQMFQYAAGRCLAEKHKDQLFIETSSLTNRPLATPREYGLNIFNISARLARRTDLIKGSDLLFRIHQIKRGFYNSVLECSRRGNIVLDGWWQDERYFKEIEGIIRKEFTFKSTDCKAADQLLRNQVASTTAVCIHVRRGDYLLSQYSHLFTVGIDYYKRAVDFISTAVQNPHFYLFSDDMEWCMENLSLDYPCTFINRKRPVAECTAEDFRLMTMCRHFIIANSSFSWWAAWLSSSDDKIIVAPITWYRNDRVTSKSITPSNWVRL